MRGGEISDLFTVKVLFEKSNARSRDWHSVSRIEPEPSPPRPPVGRLALTTFGARPRRLRWRRRRPRRATRRTSRSFPPTSSTLSSRERTRTGERCCTSPPRLVRAPGDAQRKISLHQPSSAVPIPRTAIPNVDVSAEPPRASLPPSPSGRTELVELFLAHPTGRAAVNKGDEVSPRKQGAL